MSERDWERMDDSELERALESGVPELPPADISEDVTPWRKAMNRVLAGLALTTLTLNFFGLNYILPAIGTVLLLLGFRALRSENVWFRGCWVLSLVRAAYMLLWLIMNETIYMSLIPPSAVGILTVINVVLSLLKFFFLWKGLRAVQAGTGLPARAGGAVALMCWYLLMCLLAAVNYSGIIIALAMITIYVLILRSLLRLSRELDEAGYAIRPAAVRMSDKTVVIALLTVLAAGILCGRLFFDSYPMQWQPDTDHEDAYAAKIKEELAGLGFPAYVLDDLTEDDIRACAGAQRVVVEANEYRINEVYANTVDAADEICHDADVRMTGIAVELAGGRWRLFHHFIWAEGASFRGTEALQFWTAYRDSEGWSADGEATGRVLYDSGRQTYAAPYYSLGKETYSYDSMFWGEAVNTDVFAEFSMPNDGEMQRGYVTYAVRQAHGEHIIYSVINYEHQQTWFLYPVVTAKENRMAGSWNLDESFKLIQDGLQFFPFEEDPEALR